MNAEGAGLRPVRMALIGAGQRGTHAYRPLALDSPTELQFVAVAEPHPERRARFADQHQIPPERRFSSWEDLLAAPRPADAVLVATPDRLHHDPSVAALEDGYHVLVEKPMATRVADLNNLVATADRTGRILQVCHVLRYTPFFRALHDVVTSGSLGDIATVSHRESILYWHIAHSFVRGNWRRANDAAPMILAKACHDFDLIAWNLADPVVSLQSFGSLRHFSVENAPIGAPTRCTDGCPAAEDCPFEATRLYMNESLTGWPVHVIADDLSPAGRRAALEEGPYGRCVYHCDNDVVDQQVVAMSLSSGGTVSMTVQGHGHEEARTMRRHPGHVARQIRAQKRHRDSRPLGRPQAANPDTTGQERARRRRLRCPAVVRCGGSGQRLVDRNSPRCPREPPPGVGSRAVPIDRSTCDHE